MADYDRGAVSEMSSRIVPRVPESMNYALKAPAVAAESLRTSTPPSNGSVFQPGGFINIKIPCGSYAHYLDPAHTYLRFTVEQTAAVAGVAIDSSGASFIKKIDVIGGSSSSLSSIDEWGALFAALADATVSSNDRRTTFSMTGTRPLDSTSLATLYASMTGREGAIFNTAAAAGSVTVCLPLLGPIGTGCTRMWPVGMLQGGAVELNIFLADNNSPVHVASGSPVWQIKDVALQCAFTKLEGSVERYIRSTIPAYHLPTVDWKHTTGIYSPTDSVINMNLPFNYSSLSLVIVSVRDVVNLSAATKRSITGRTRGQIKTAYLNVGTRPVPSIPITVDANCAEPRAELAKAFNMIGHATASSCLSSEIYSLNTVGAEGGFLLAFALDAFHAQEAIVADGVNLEGQQLTLVLTRDSTPVAMQNIRIDVWGAFDLYMNFSNGMVSAVSNLRSIKDAGK